MKKLLLCIASLLVAKTLSAQEVKRVVLSPKSNISTAQIAEGFHKYCSNVLVTEDSSKADYTLEAAEDISVFHGDSVKRWHFTILDKDGDVLFTTHPRFSLKNRYAHHFEDTCRYINGEKTK